MAWTAPKIRALLSRVPAPQVRPLRAPQMNAPQLNSAQPVRQSRNLSVQKPSMGPSPRWAQMDSSGDYGRR
ncbi:MAG: hypothetical protein JO041_15605 [Acidobacteria bacterium]|nr:hypothetical protein [Acidobacteriota bacterium]